MTRTIPKVENYQGSLEKKTNAYAICNCCGSKLKAKGSQGWSSGSIVRHLVNKHKITSLSEEEQLQLEPSDSLKRKFKQYTLMNSMSKGAGKKIKSASELRDDQITAAAVWVAESK